MVELECSGEHQPNKTSGHYVAIPAFVNGKWQITFNYQEANGHPPSQTHWRTGIRVANQPQTWLLVYPDGKEETVDILTAEGPAPTVPRIQDPFKWLRRLFPWMKFPPPPIFRKRS